MKFRLDFVTNSSSSSFIIISKVNRTSELDKFMKEEYGNYGLRLLNTYLVKGIKETTKYEDNDYVDFNGYDVPAKVYSMLDENSNYLVSEHISYTNEGNTEGDDAWLYNHIPENYLENIYEQEED